LTNHRQIYFSRINPANLQTHLRNTGDLFFLSDTVQPLKLHASTLAIIKLRHQSARTRAAQLQIARAITTRKSWSVGRGEGAKMEQSTAETRF